MIHRLKQQFICFLIASFSFVGFTQSVQAAMIGTDQVVAAGNEQAIRDRVAATLDRPQLQARLQELGISQEQAKSRVAALTNDEVSALANKIDNLPAGGDGGIIEALIFVFIVLLITDILGFTKVFPFTRSIKH